MSPSTLVCQIRAWPIQSVSYDRETVRRQEYGAPESNERVTATFSWSN
jgi:hypothetical protein